MSGLPQKLPSPVRETTPDAVRLAKTLIRTASFGSIAVLDPRNGRPYVSRVLVATDFDGTPVTLISQLSLHTKSLLADPGCSLLLGEPGKGDPLAYPRISLSCTALFLDHGTQEAEIAATRFIRCNPKPKLYAEFADFSFVRLEPGAASLNGGFGQAFEIGANELLSPKSETLCAAETRLIEDLNGTESPGLAAFARKAGLRASGRILAIGCDCEGIDIVTGGMRHRLWFEKPVLNAENVIAGLSA